MDQQYMNSLEIASVSGDILPFTKFIANLVEQTMSGHPIANLNNSPKKN
jgi:hypothetical protein